MSELQSLVVQKGKPFFLLFFFKVQLLYGNTPLRHQQQSPYQERHPWCIAIFTINQLEHVMYVLRPLLTHSRSGLFLLISVAQDRTVLGSPALAASISKDTWFFIFIYCMSCSPPTQVNVVKLPSAISQPFPAGSGHWAVPAELNGRGPSLTQGDLINNNS